jgi:hypothetical protein
MGLLVPGFRRMTPPPLSKPAPGVGINWSHPFAQGLLSVLPFNDPKTGPDNVILKDYGTELTWQYNKGAKASPVWVNSGTVQGLYSPGVANCMDAINFGRGLDFRADQFDGLTALSWIKCEPWTGGADTHRTVIDTNLITLTYDWIFAGGSPHYIEYTTVTIPCADGISRPSAFPNIDFTNQLSNLNTFWGINSFLVAVTARFYGTSDSQVGPLSVEYTLYNQWGKVSTLLVPGPGAGLAFPQLAYCRPVPSATGQEFIGTQYAELLYNYCMDEGSVMALINNPLQMFNANPMGGQAFNVPDGIHHLPAVTLVANPTSGRAGDPYILTWTSSYADTLSIDQSVGSVLVPTGTTTVYPTVTTTYTIIATNAYGTATATATITITSAPRRSPGVILQRDLTKTTDVSVATAGVDNGTPYAAFATIGSVVLVQPGELALLLHLTTEATAAGSHPGVSILLDEVAASMAVPFTALVLDAPDPAIKVASQTVYADRFYVSETRQAAACRHMQVKVSWPAEAFANELLTWSVIGAHTNDR